MKKIETVKGPEKEMTMATPADLWATMHSLLGR
jgi:hypothetical protein